MSSNHEMYAKANPFPYSGKVTKPETPQSDMRKCSVVEAANHHNLPQIIARFGDWAICEDGIHCLYLRYYIDKVRLEEPDWIEHVTEKFWVNPKDFIDAFQTAREMVADGKI
jgi:hypothetical protein